MISNARVIEFKRVCRELGRIDHSLLQQAQITFHAQPTARTQARTNRFISHADAPLHARYETNSPEPW